MTLVKHGTVGEQNHAKSDLKALSTVVQPQDLLSTNDVEGRDQSQQAIIKIQTAVYKLAQRPKKCPFIELQAQGSNKRVKSNVLQQASERRQSRMDVAKKCGRNTRKGKAPDRAE